MDVRNGLGIHFLVELLVLVHVSLFKDCAWSYGHGGVDRPNGDLPGMPIFLDDYDPVHKPATPSSCWSLCQKHNVCNAWVFQSANCSQSASDATEGSSVAMCWLKGIVTSQQDNRCAVSGVKSTSLLPLVYKDLPVAAIQPTGWLHDQLAVQAKGLTGHLADFWPYLNQSIWIGGKIDTDLNQNVPYWLNGLVPLAFQLNDPDLLKQVKLYMDYILSHIQSNGWLGPPAHPHDGDSYWGRFPLLLALIQYHEANPDDSRVIPAILGHLHASYTMMATVPLASWAAARYQDLVLVCHWLLDNNKTEEEQFVWDLAELAHQQGFDWESWFDASSFPQESVQKPTPYTHGVNNAQAIKSCAVWYRQSQNATDRESCYTRIQKLDTYHSMASGMFSADEHLAGLMPSRGVELCAVVEAIFSYNVIFRGLGDPIFAERAEMIAYNALPATFTKDMWAHQYLQQPNEMNAIHSDDHIWEHDGPDATLYGLAPNFRCCTANYHQGWPKFVSNMVKATPDGGLLVSTWGPVSVVTENINMTIVSDYPFGDNATVIIQPRFREDLTPVYFRIPSWSLDTTITIDGVPQSNVVAGSIFNTTCMGTECDYLVQFNATPRLTRRFNNAAAVYRGSLLYSLSLVENFTVLHQYEFQSKDYQVTTPSSWNYALYLPRRDDDISKVVTFAQRAMPANGVSPYYPPASPVSLSAKGQLLKNWSVAHNAAEPPPASPISNNGTMLLDNIVLLPYGATCLRIAELPTLLGHN